MAKKEYASPIAVLRMFTVEDVIRTSGELKTGYIDGHNVKLFNLGWFEEN